MFPDSLQGFRFNLADSLAGHAKLFAHFFQSVGDAVFQTEAHRQNFLLPRSQINQNFF